MKILVIGGTSFVGRHFVEAALAAGHDVTLFHRGKTGADLFPQAETILGDRTQDVSALTSRSWDAVFDTCGYTPHAVRLSSEALEHAAAHYAFVSTISVYRDFAAPGRHEGDSLGILHDPDTEEVNAETYGPLKVLCEQVVQRYFAHRGLIVRPGMIVGPYDPTRRFTALIVRAARGGRMIVPGPPDAPFQCIDARDLAAWTLGRIAAGTGGVFNAVGPTATVGEVLAAAKDAAGADTEFVSVDGAFLEGHGVDPHALNPWFVPQPEGGYPWRTDASKAVAQGLTFRPLAETVRDTLAWDRSLPPERRQPPVLPAEREEELLNEWKARA